MTNYVKFTNFTVKDSLPTGDTNKVIRGAEFDTEFDAIVTAVATKSDLSAPTFTGEATFADLTATGTVNFSSATVSNLGAVTTADINGGTIDGVTIGGSSAGAGTFSSLVATTADINGGTVDNATIGGATPGAGTFSSLVATTADINGGSIDGAVIGGSTPAAVSGTTGTFSGAVSGTTGTFSGAVTGSNLNISNWDTAFGWGDHSTEGYLTNVTFSDMDAGAITTSGETFANSDTQIPTNAAVRNWVLTTYPTIVELNDLTANVTWATVPDAFISASSVNQHVSVEKATQSKTYALNEASTLTLSSSISSGVPVVSVTKEVPQTGVTNNDWDVDSTAENYTRLNSATATTLTPSAVGDGTFTLGTGSFTSADVGKTIEGNGGVAILTATDGSYVTTTDFTDTSAIASGSWEMYAVVYNTTDGDLELSIFDQTYDISTASFVDSFSTNSQEIHPQDVAFNTDGTKMFVTGQGSDAVQEYHLSTGFDVSTASHDSSFSVSSQETAPRALAFNPAGTKMFVAGSTGDDVNEYTLSTGFDVSTASFVDSFDVSARAADPSGLAFNTDGTKMFLVGTSQDHVAEYALSTGFDVSTASYTRDYNLNGIDTSPRGLAFNSDGTKMFLVGNAGNDVNEFALATGFDITTSNVTHVRTFDVSSQDTDMKGLAFNADGTKMFICGDTGNDINEYTLGGAVAPSGYHAAHTTTSTDSTNWTDINSMTADQAVGDGAVYYCVSTDDRTTWKVARGTDGERSIARNNSGTWQYNSNGTYGSETWANATTNAELPAIQQAMELSSLTSGFDLASGSYIQAFSVLSQESNPTGLAFNTDGTKMFVLGDSGNDVNEYTLSTGFDVSTASFVDSFSVNSQETDPSGIAFNTDGTKMFIVGQAGDDVNEYSLSTGFDVSTASFTDSASISSEDNAPKGLTFNNDGTKMYVVGGQNKSVYQYALTTGFDVSTKGSVVNTFSVNAQDTNPRDVKFNSDGTKMYIPGGEGQDINEYTLSTAYDISTASFSQSFDVSGQESFPCDVAFNSTGTKMFVLGNSGDDVIEYHLNVNQMDKTQLEAVADANHFTLANDLDLAIIFNMSSGSTAPSSDGVSINFDANALNQGAVLGTDYNFDFPAANKVRITSLAAQNLKVRII